MFSKSHQNDLKLIVAPRGFQNHLIIGNPLKFFFHKSLLLCVFRGTHDSRYDHHDWIDDKPLTGDQRYVGKRFLVKHKRLVFGRNRLNGNLFWENQTRKRQRVFCIWLLAKVSTNFFFYLVISGYVIKRHLLVYFFLRFHKQKIFCRYLV